MILSDGEIWEALESGTIGLTPYPYRGLLQGSSIDLRLGAELLVHRRTPVAGVSIDPSAVDVMDHLQRYCDRIDLSAGPYEIQPDAFVIGQTLEKLDLPRSLAGRVEGKSSLARFGLAVHITAPKIDPGFNGNITLEMKNFGPFPLRLTQAMPICGLTFENLGRSAMREYQGRFQN